MAHAIRTTAALAAVLLALAGLGACSGSDDGGKAAPKRTTTTAARPATSFSGPCGSHDEDPGVIRSWCDGPASISFTIGTGDDAVTGTLRHGTCKRGNGHLTLNAGTAGADDVTGRRPNYAGARFPRRHGSFEAGDASMVIVWKGTIWPVAELTGSHDGHDGLFEGVTGTPAQRVTGAFHC